MIGQREGARVWRNGSDAKLVRGASWGTLWRGREIIEIYEGYAGSGGGGDRLGAAVGRLR